MTTTDESFRIEIQNDGNTCVVRLIGELDLAGCDQVEEALRQAAGENREQILIDIDGLRFIDSTGLALLLDASRRGHGEAAVRITRGNGQVAQVLRLTGLDRALPLD